eukprot:TRINITY_DN506_c0_g1_i1.p1 TRINITY_DN506_c0_g1~~TRINITY_DN506_c0_g1_i1.p1  ORF type:complete len:424 (+),score=67.81 TRINITY_DN506_c0_g1_i1:76-1272(+)
MDKYSEMMLQMNGGELCSGCRTPRETAMLRCGACKQVKYCSQRCQRLHWRRCHKADCSAYVKFEKNLRRIGMLVGEGSQAVLLQDPSKYVPRDELSDSDDSPFEISDDDEDDYDDVEMDSSDDEIESDGGRGFDDLWGDDEEVGDAEWTVAEEVYEQGMPGPEAIERAKMRKKRLPLHPQSRKEYVHRLKRMFRDTGLRVDPPLAMMYHTDSLSTQQLAAVLACYGLEVKAGETRKRTQHRWEVIKTALRMVGDGKLARPRVDLRHAECAAKHTELTEQWKALNSASTRATSEARVVYYALQEYTQEVEEIKMHWMGLDDMNVLHKLFAMRKNTAAIIPASCQYQPGEAHVDETGVDPVVVGALILYCVAPLKRSKAVEACRECDNDFIKALAFVGGR